MEELCTEWLVPRPRWITVFVRVEGVAERARCAITPSANRASVICQESDHPAASTGRVPPA